MKQPQSSVFKLDTVEFTGGTEQILRGGRDKFPLLHQAFAGVKQIGFIGWGSQGPAQSQNLRDTLKSIGSDIVVKVGLRDGSESFAKAREAGFSEEDGTLGEMFEVIADSDIVIVLISDGAQAEGWRDILGAMKPGATLGLSHGFLLGYLESQGSSFPSDISVIMMAPKGMGRSVRLLYEQGAETEGAGINSSVAVVNDVDGRALDYALGWAVGTGSPATFFTTMKQEVISDLFGERAMLLGGLWGASEALYRHFLAAGIEPEQCFLASAKGITSTVSEMISKLGLRGCAEEFAVLGYGEIFDIGYSTAYPAMRSVMLEIYENVASLREIVEVVEETGKLARSPMPSIETSDMWRVARESGLYAAKPDAVEGLAFSAGVYIAGIMAQMSILRERGHCASEIVNESLIEAIDSLNPFMDKRGVSYMVDNCSTTARLGARKWGPKFAEALHRVFSSGPVVDPQLLKEFVGDPIHSDIDTCFGFRPPVKIAVS